MSVNTEFLTPNYLQKWNWRVEIDGYERAAFTQGDRPKVEFEDVEISPGGTHRSVKAPGRATFDNLTFSKGVLLQNDPAFVEWMEEIMAFEGGSSTSNDFNTLFKTIDIVEYNQQDMPVNRWRLFGAYIRRFDGGDLDGSASEVVTEEIEIAYQYFQKVR